MRTFLETALSAKPALGTAALAIAVPSFDVRDPSRSPAPFWGIVLLASPIALDGAMIMGDFVMRRAAQRRDRPRLVWDARLLGLTLAGIALVLTLNLLASAFALPSPRDRVPKVVAAGVAGGSGLTWGALGSVGRERIA